MIGFSIQPIARRVSPEVARKYRSIPVANVSDCMSRLTGGGPRLRPYHGGGVLSGPAFTVKTRPGDNLMVHKALDIASPGDVVVIDAGDLILGDGDGLLCIPFDQVEEVYQAAAAKNKAEDKTLAELKAGRSMDRAWVDLTLAQLGCKVPG